MSSPLIQSGSMEKLSVNRARRILWDRDECSLYELVPEDALAVASGHGPFRKELRRSLLIDESSAPVTQRTPIAPLGWMRTPKTGSAHSLPQTPKTEERSRDPIITSCRRTCKESQAAGGRHNPSPSNWRLRPTRLVRVALALVVHADQHQYERPNQAGD